MYEYINIKLGNSIAVNEIVNSIVKWRVIHLFSGLNGVIYDNSKCIK